MRIRIYARTSSTLSGKMYFYTSEESSSLPPPSPPPIKICSVIGFGCALLFDISVSFADFIYRIYFIYFTFYLRIKNINYSTSSKPSDSLDTLRTLISLTLRILKYSLCSINSWFNINNYHPSSSLEVK